MILVKNMIKAMIGCPPLAAERLIISLLKKPPAGGIPIRDREARINMAVTPGISLATITKSEIFLLPVLSITAPAQRNRQLLATAWLAVWNNAPLVPPAVPKPIPIKI